MPAARGTASSRPSSASPAAPRPARAAVAPRLSADSAPLASVPEPDVPRRPFGIGELDRVLGGGIVVGSIVLVGGEPGIGKSTLLLQAAAGACAHRRRNRAVRDRRGVGCPGSPPGGPSRAARVARPATRIRVAAETEVGRIAEIARAERPPLVIVDSIQTSTVDELDGPGRQRRPGARVGAATDGAREVRVDRGRARRPRDEGRLARRAEDPGAPRRRGPRARGRALLAAPARPRLEEPLRLDRGGRACSRWASAGMRR